MYGITHKLTAALCLAAACLALPGPARAQTPLLKDEFEEKSDGWVALGPHGKVGVTTEAGKAKNGKGALEFRYVIAGKAADGKPGVAPVAAGDPKPDTPPVDFLLRSTAGGLLTKMRTLRFQIKTDADTPLVVTLSEKNGGRYVAMLWVPKGDWQDCVMTPDEFWLADDANDPKDPDGKLDLDAVDNIGLADVFGFFAPSMSASGEGGFSEAGLHVGPHTLLLDDFTISADPPAALPATENTGLVLDTFNRDILRWFAIGEAQLRLDSAAPTKTRALRADYAQGDGKYVVLIRNARNLKAGLNDSLVVDVASTKSCRLVLTLEERNGSHYALSLAVPGDSDPIHRVLGLSEFALAEGAKDDDGHLDLDQVKTLTITDITGAYGIARQKNTLWVGPLRIQKK